MRRKRHQLARHKAIPLLIALQTQRRALKQGSEIKRRKRIQHHHLVGGIRIKGVVEREKRGAVVEGDVERAGGVGELVHEAREEFGEVAFALGGGDGGAGAVVVVE